MAEPHPPPRPALRAALVIAAVVAAFFSPALLTSDQFAYRDTGRMHLPVKRYLAAEMRRAHLPEWNPYSGLGAPLVADAVQAVQHPFNLLLLAFPFDLGLKLWVVLSYFVAAAGAWLWARRLGRGWHAALSAGLAYALSGFLVSSSDNLTYLTALAALPWIFAATHGFVERGGPGRLALVGCASAFAAAAGDPQSWGFAVLLIVPYALLAAGGPEGRRRAALRGVAAAAAAVVAAAPFVLPVLAWLPHSARADAFATPEYQRWNLHPLRLLELVVPHLFDGPKGTLFSPAFAAYAGTQWSPIPWVTSVYLGLVAAALAAVGAARHRSARLLCLGAAAFAWMAMGPYAGFGQIARYLPALGSFRYWEKLAVWPALLLAVAAAHGFDRLLADRGDARRLAASGGTAGALLLLVSAAIHLFPERAARLVLAGPDPEAALGARWLVSNLADGTRAAGLAAVALALVALAVARPRLARLGPGLLLAAVLVDVFGANAGSYRLSPRAVTDARPALAARVAAEAGLQRVVTPFTLAPERWPEMSMCDAAWLWGRLTLAPAWNVEERIGNFEIYAGMPPARASRHMRRKGLTRLLPSVGMWSVGWVVVPRQPELAVQVNLPPPYRVAASDPFLPAHLLEVPHRPRAYLARELASASPGAALDFVADDGAFASDRSVVEGPVPADYRPPRGEARIVRDEPERVEVETVSDRPALLVLNDVFAAGWTARVEGRSAQILPANYLARGVWVGAGRHLVSFAYRTPGLREGWALAAAFFLGLGAWGAARARRQGAAAAGSPA